MFLRAVTGLHTITTMANGMIRTVTMCETRRTLGGTMTLDTIILHSLVGAEDVLQKAKGLPIEPNFAIYCPGSLSRWRSDL